MKVSHINIDKISDEFNSGVFTLETLDVVDRLIFSYEEKKSDKYDYILVLGCPTCVKHRAVTAVEAYKKGFSEKLVFSGGVKIPNTDVTECEGMKEFAIKNNINEENIILENQSKFTHENIIYSAKIMNELSLNKPYSVLVVTSVYHTRRALMNFLHYKDLFEDKTIFEAFASESESASRTNWHKTPKGINIIKREFCSLCDYVKQGYLPDIDF